jgi:hypothetical protein
VADAVFGSNTSRCSCVSLLLTVLSSWGPPSSSWYCRDNVCRALRSTRPHRSSEQRLWLLSWMVSLRRRLWSPCALAMAFRTWNAPGACARSKVCQLAAQLWCHQYATQQERRLGTMAPESEAP